MEAPWKAGDIGSAHCPTCDQYVTTRFVRRSLFLPRTRLRVREVLVSMCTACETLLSVPRQSIAQLREVGVGK